MYIRGFRDGGIAVHGDRHGGFFGKSDSGLGAIRAPIFGFVSFVIQRLRGVAIPLRYFFGLAGRALLRLPALFVFHRLLFEVVEGFTDGDRHVLGLSYADQRAIARADSDFSLVTMLFDDEDDMRFEFGAENFTDFREAGFNFFFYNGSDFVMTSGEFHIHEAALLC